MAESVDALVSNTSRFTPVPVRPRLWVRKEEDESLPLFSFTLRRGRCSCGGSADLSALCKCAVLLRNIRILIEKSSVQINLTSSFQSSFQTFGFLHISSARSTLACGGPSTHSKIIWVRGNGHFWSPL